MKHVIGTVVLPPVLHIKSSASYTYLMGDKINILWQLKKKNFSNHIFPSMVFWVKSA